MNPASFFGDNGDASAIPLRSDRTCKLSLIGQPHVPHQRAPAPLLPFTCPHRNSIIAVSLQMSMCPASDSVIMPTPPAAALHEELHRHSCQLGSWMAHHIGCR
ncbi:hypothetical protein IQ07DRAFT_159433 [Pyrenochaeta sp. DS3sAY3a]|nr:hypothetical protein IQ07DRAFT_159433 [Pyrenochaeta sp. DS3sAY3a]